MKNNYLEVTQEAGAELFKRDIQGEIVMLNLLRFRQIADYSANPELAQTEKISGVEAFQRYIDHTLPLLRKTGGDITFLGKGGHFLIGPQDEHWDFVMLIRQNSLADFMSFSSNQEYLKGLGHRTAAIEDSRLLPLEETTSAS
jgi:hypothetical protein